MNDDSLVYAGLIPRGLAYLLDCIIVFAFFAGTQLVIFTPVRQVLGMDEAWFYSGLHTEIYTLLTISLPVWLYFALCERSGWRATPGKRILKLQVVRFPGGARIRFWRSVGRTVLKLLPWEIAHLVNNFPQPMMYAPEPGFRLGFIGVGVLMGIYIAVVGLTRYKQGIHDFAAETVVVKTGR